MNTRSIVIEQRLRTTWLTTPLAMLMMGLVVVGVIVTKTHNGRSISLLAATVDVFVLIVLFTAFVLFLRVDVRVVEAPGGRMLEVVYGPSGLVRQQFVHDTMVSASARTVSLRQTGGWGYRGSLRLFRFAVMASRSGDALELKLRGNRRFVVTVDNPQDFVFALAI